MKLAKMMKSKKKGFTLVEIIVVLVIIAILAAALIPTMSGLIKEAKQKANIAQLRAGYVAATAIAAEKNAYGTVAAADVTDAKIKSYLDESYDAEDGSDDYPGSFAATITAGKISAVSYTLEDGTVLTLSAGGGVTIS